MSPDCRFHSGHSPLRPDSPDPIAASALLLRNQAPAVAPQEAATPRAPARRGRWARFVHMMQALWLTSSAFVLGSEAVRAGKG